MPSRPLVDIVDELIAIARSGTVPFELTAHSGLRVACGAVPGEGNAGSESRWR
jgi:hypothetical protein